MMRRLFLVLLCLGCADATAPKTTCQAVVMRDTLGRVDTSLVRICVTR